MGILLTVNGAVCALVAVLCFSAVAYAAAMRRRARNACTAIETLQRREHATLEAVSAFTGASRDSSAAVLAALDGSLRACAPALDAIAVFVPDGEDLRCTFTSGPRAEHYPAIRLRRDDAAALPARAAHCRHRVALDGRSRPLIPTDRAALAVPMVAGDRLCAVVYLGALTDCIGDADLLVRLVMQAGAPFALAAEREADRASATFDALTGLFTPRAFRRRLHDDVAAAQVTGATITLWFVDTDRFKRVNDSLGHSAGDVVLQKMAGLLRAHTVAGVDLAARNGGDEFCAIVREAQKLLAVDRAQDLCDAVRAFDFGIAVPITASIGVASFPFDAAGAAELLEAADAAMYHSKRAGRDRVSFAAGHGSFSIYRQ